MLAQDNPHLLRTQVRILESENSRLLSENIALEGRLNKANRELEMLLQMRPEERQRFQGDAAAKLRHLEAQVAESKRFTAERLAELERGIREAVSRFGAADREAALAEERSRKMKAAQEALSNEVAEKIKSIVESQSPLILQPNISGIGVHLPKLYKKIIRWITTPGGKHGDS